MTGSEARELVAKAHLCWVHKAGGVAAATEAWEPQHMIGDLEGTKAERWPS